MGLQNFRATTFPGIVFSGENSSLDVESILSKVERKQGKRVWIVDPNVDISIFETNSISSRDEVLRNKVSSEPTTDYVDKMVKEIRESSLEPPSTIIGLGGGSTMDVAKAVSVCLTSNRPSADLQGWDLVSNPAIPKIAIPTIAGTGAEASRTAVLTHSENGLKLGINSDYSRFDAVVLDPVWQYSVPKDLFFRTVMDAFFHAHEILTGSYRNVFSDQLAEQAIRNIESIFDEDEFRIQNVAMRALNASFFSGLALTSSYVGLIHPLSAAIGVQHDLPHSLANLVALNGLRSQYPEAFKQVHKWGIKVDYQIPRLSEVSKKAPDVESLLSETKKHGLPLENFYGPDWSEHVTYELFEEILEKI